MVYSVKLNTSPKGAGDVQEVSGRVGLFPQENNVVWLKFKTLQSGTMTIKILPDSSNTDYDFLLFSLPENSSLDKILNRSHKLIRSNCARTQNIDEGKTGLSCQSGKKDHVHQGIGASFSNSLEVKRGETYILVLNNVTGDGAGVEVFFDYWKSKKIEDNNGPWIIGFSGGKDSTVLLTLTWLALLKIKQEDNSYFLSREVWVVCNDTLVNFCLKTYSLSIKKVRSFAT